MDNDPNPERQTEPTWAGKVLVLSSGLAARQLPYAFGGAIALNYHREPRSTLDIDINVFIDPANQAQVLEAMQQIYGLPDAEKVQQELAENGQARSRWGNTYIDLFFANTDFHQSMASRVVYEKFANAEIPVLSIEDLLVCKVLFDRPKDWVDVDAVVATRAGQLDGDYMGNWLTYFLSSDDHRLQKFRQRLADNQ